METFLLFSTILLWLIVLINFILTLALIRRWKRDDVTAPKPDLISLKTGEPAPDFSAKSLDGGDVSLLVYRGKKLIFLFVRPGCSACHETLPHYNDWASEGKRVGLDVVLVNFGTEDETLKLKEKYNLELPILYVPDGNSFEKDYEIIGVPSYCFIDASGVVQRTGYSPDLTNQIKHLSDSST